MKTTVFSALLFSAFVLFQQTLHAQSAADEQALRDWLSNGLQTWYSGDANRLADMYAENALMINWMGQETKGKTAIRERIAQDFAQEKPDPANFNMTINEVRFLNPNAAIVVSALKGKSVMEGKTFEWSAYATMVLSRTSGKWQIELDQTTGVQPPQGQ